MKGFKNSHAYAFIIYRFLVIFARVLKHLIRISSYWFYCCFMIATSYSLFLYLMRWDSVCSKSFFRSYINIYSRFFMYYVFCIMYCVIRIMYHILYIMHYVLSILLTSLPVIGLVSNLLCRYDRSELLGGTTGTPAAGSAVISRTVYTIRHPATITVCFLLLVNMSAGWRMV